MGFAHRLDELMKEQGLTQQALAKKSGVAQSTVAGWIKDKSEPTAGNLNAVCRALRTPREWLLKGTGAKRLAADQLDPLIVREDPPDYGRMNRVQKYVTFILENASSDDLELFEGVIEPFARRIRESLKEGTAALPFERVPEAVAHKEE